MLTSLLVIVAVGALIYIGKRWETLPEEERKDFGKKILIYGGAGIVLALVVTGRAHWLMGILAALLALASRAAQLAQYFPLFKRLMGEKQAPVAASTEMTRQDAADILGIDPNASAEDIRLAHKKLMQKIHPDRGGSDALAKHINQAKDVLLG